MTAFRREPADILAELAQLRAADAPTHGGRVLSYVYDSGEPELDELAAAAARLVQPVNGLDPTTFTSVAAMESGLVGFARRVFHGATATRADVVVGSVTSGGTESCLLAVKTAREVWRSARLGTPRVPRIVAPDHRARGLPEGGRLLRARARPRAGRPGDGHDHAGRDRGAARRRRRARGAERPVVPVRDARSRSPTWRRSARRAASRCTSTPASAGSRSRSGPTTLPAWDLAVPGVTSLSADLHKYGYAPKGVSVLLTRGRDRQRHQYFATTGWPGYPVVNPTMAGSKPAGPLAAAWSITEALGESGFAELTARAARATAALRDVVDGIDGLRVVGDPTGPLLAVATDDGVEPARRVDPHQWADAARASGWHLQLQPGLAQADGTRLPHTTHLTITPVTEAAVPELAAALVRAADEVRGVPAVDGRELVAGLTAQLPGGAAALAAASEGLDSETAAGLLAAFGLLGGEGAGGALPDRLAPVLALVEALPAPLTERLLVELLARVVEPRD